MNLLEEDKRIKQLKIDTITLELHAINNKSSSDGGNTLLNAKKVMLELRRDVLNGN